jgi:hypothetical protein
VLLVLTLTLTSSKVQNFRRPLPAISSAKLAKKCAFRILIWACPTGVRPIQPKHLQINLGRQEVQKKRKAEDTENVDPSGPCKTAVLFEFIIIFLLGFFQNICAISNFAKLYHYRCVV